MILLNLHEGEVWFMKSEINYSLVLETKPNSYDPIFIYPNISNIDTLTGHYSKEDFSRMLYKNYYIDEENIDKPLAIIYNDNGIRKVKEGIIYKDEYVNNISEYVIDFINKNKDNGNIINQIYQYVVDRKDISENFKKLLHSLIVNRKNEEKFDSYLWKLNINSYYDVRSIYLYIINTLIPKLDDNKDNILTRRIEK